MTSGYGDISLPWQELGDRLLELPEPFVDARGAIQQIVVATTGSCVLISCVPGAVRGNHYHREDWHYAYVISGQMNYYSRTVGDTAPPTLTVVSAGQLVFTPPGVEHAMVFEEPSVFLALGGSSRRQEYYEADLIRTTLIDPGA